MVLFKDEGIDFKDEGVAWFPPEDTGQQGVGIVCFDPAPVAPNARYDLIVVGTDGLIHVVKGTASTDPVMPDVPSDHIKLAHILILGGMTEILAEHINATWKPRIASSMEIVLTGSLINADQEFQWSVSGNYPTCNFTITIYDQYGWILSGVSYDWKVEFLHGSGRMYPSGNGLWTGTTYEANAANPLVMTYERDQTGSENSPIFAITVTTTTTVLGGKSLYIQLLNAGGGEIT